MERERLIEIFKETKADWSDDNAFQGLVILSKYASNLLCAAEHDIIYSVNLDDILENITEDDAIKLRKLNWMIESEFDCLACFV